MEYDVREHVFGLRTADIGDPRASGLISDEIIANIALLVSSCKLALWI
jgi:hypothetical protein